MEEKSQIFRSTIQHIVFQVADKYYGTSECSSQCLSLFVIICISVYMCIVDSFELTFLPWIFVMFIMFISFIDRLNL